LVLVGWLWLVGLVGLVGWFWLVLVGLVAAAIGIGKIVFRSDENAEAGPRPQLC